MVSDTNQNETPTLSLSNLVIGCKSPRLLETLKLKLSVSVSVPEPGELPEYDTHTDIDKGTESQCGNQVESVNSSPPGLNTDLAVSVSFYCNCIVIEL